MDINGGNSEISSGDSELAFFIAKYDSNANLIWTKTMSGSGTGTGNLISVDEEGGIYAAGTFSGTIQFGTQSMTAASVENTDNFLVKYSADGNMIWARSLTGSKLDDINAMVVAGNQVVIGGVIRSEDLVVDNAPEVTMKSPGHFRKLEQYADCLFRYKRKLSMELYSRQYQPTDRCQNNCHRQRWLDMERRYFFWNLLF